MEEVKLRHRNGVRYSYFVKYQARQLRQQGKTYREIVERLDISLGSAHLWTKEIALTPEQKLAIQIRANQSAFTPERREKLRKLAQINLVPRLERYTKKDLLDKIKNFRNEHGRIPLKREFNMYGEYKRRFGSWNKAIELAGFSTNPVIFSKKYRSVDGHLCDSLSEKIIDDYLYKNSIKHARSVSYPGHPKLKADFLVKNVFIEYFGLSGEIESYNEMILRKRKICSANSIHLVEVYPKDLFPKDRLAEALMI